MPDTPEHDPADQAEREIATDESESFEMRERLLAVLRRMRARPLRYPRG